MDIEKDIDLTENIKNDSLEINKKNLFNYKEISEEEIKENLRRPGNLLDALTLILGMQFLFFVPAILTSLFKDILT